MTMMRPIQPVTPVDPHRLPVLDAEMFPPLPEAVLFPAGFSDKAWKTGKLFEDFSAQASPEGYKWFYETTFVSMLSMVAMRRIKIPFSTPDYTPLMALLAAEPATYKKTTTANVAALVMSAAGLPWLVQSSRYTPQKMIHDMAGAIPKDYAVRDELKQRRFKQRRAFAGQRALIIGEAGQFLKSMTQEAGSMAEYHPLLLEMDDCKPTYDSGTLSRDDETVENPYMTILGCMTPGNVRKLAKESGDLYGSGFWSRVVVVCPPEDGMIDNAYGEGEVSVPFSLHNAISKWHDRLGVPECDIEQAEEPDKKGELQPVAGRYIVTAEPLPENTVTFGPGVYEAWKRYRSALKTISVTSLAFGDLKANYDRLPTRAMRVAALLASLENDGVIELCHWAKAQEIAERWRLFLHELYRQSNMSSGSKIKSLSDLMIDLLTKFGVEGKTPTIREMQQRTSRLHGIQRKTIEECLTHLQRDGLVAAPIKDGKKTTYALMPPEQRGLRVVQSPIDDDDVFDPNSEGM